MSSREEQLAGRLAVLRGRIESACADAGRDPGEVTLVVVTKTFPATDVRALAALGVRDVAENRDQEAAAKAAACVDLGLTWHFVGQLQTNKARSVARYAAVVHSVDRPRLVDALSAAVPDGWEIAGLVQVGLDTGAGRGGAPPDQVPALAAAVAAAPGLRLAGLMAVAPLGAEPDAAFARLAALSARLRADHPGAAWVSAGMSGDLEAAIRHGATHVRVGSAILGARSVGG